MRREREPGDAGHLPARSWVGSRRRPVRLPGHHGVILTGMTHKVGAKGQVVIPKAIRDRIGIRPGDHVIFDAEGEGVRIRRADRVEATQAERIKALRGSWSGETSGTEELLAARRDERRREERRAEGHGVGRL